jgi:hypothetical protein
LETIASGPFKKTSGEDRQALRRVKEFTRAHFRLAEDDTIFVTEVACALPGCPPLETLIAFWTAGAKRHHYKVFKAVVAVTEDDLPPWWMKDSLAVDEMAGCDCC